MKNIKNIIDLIFTWKDDSFYSLINKDDGKSVRLNPFTLSFPKSLEEDFLENYYENSIRLIKFSAIAGSILFVAFFLFDLFLVPELFEYFLALRVGIVSIILSISLLILENSKNKKIVQPLISIAVIIIGIINIVFMTIAFPKLNSYYYVGIMLVYFWAYTFLRLRYLWSALSGFSILVIYLITFLFIEEMEMELFFISSSYLFAANLAGLGIAYSMEYYYRKDFHQNLVLQKSLQDNISLHEKISQNNRVIDIAEEKLTLQSKALESAANSIVIFNKEGNIIWCNKAFTKLTGYEVDELIGKNPRILNSGKHSKLFYKNLWTTILNGSVWSGEIINRKKNGSLYYEEMMITPVMENGSGTISNFIAVKQDITARKEMEENLFESEKRLRELFENATMGIYRSTLKGEILMANDALIKMLGFNSLEELQNRSKTTSGYVIEGQRDLFIEKLKISGSLTGFESGWRKKDGTLIYIRESARLYEDENGEVIFEGTVEDITLSKLAEAEIEESRERLQVIVDNLYDAIFIHDLDGRIINVNNKVLDLYNVSRENILEMSIEDISSDQNSMETAAKYWNSVVNDGKTFKFEWKAMRPKDKFIFDVEVFLSRITLNTNDYILANVRDISEQKEAAQSLIEAKEMAEQSDRLKSEFLAGMSHEIRTPINTILNFISLIRSDLGNNISEDIKSSFEMIDSGSRRLIRTIDSILNMSQLQSGSYDLKMENISIVDEVLTPLISEFKEVANQKKIGFFLEDKTKDKFICVDRYTVSQLFINLIDNALKYTKTGVVKVVVESDNKYIITKISDTGIGISNDFLPTLFEPFVQEEMGYTRSYEGTGLGLALVKNYIEMNNGIIEVDSTKGRGSTFTVKFEKVGFP